MSREGTTRHRKLGKRLFQNRKKTQRTISTDAAWQSRFKHVRACLDSVAVLLLFSLAFTTGTFILVGEVRYIAQNLVCLHRSQIVSASAKPSSVTHLKALRFSWKSYLGMISNDGKERSCVQHEGAWTFATISAYPAAGETAVTRCNASKPIPLAMACPEHVCAMRQEGGSMRPPRHTWPQAATSDGYGMWRVVTAEDHNAHPASRQSACLMSETADEDGAPTRSRRRA